MKSRTYYYSTYNDDFAATDGIKTKVIDDNYRYNPKNPILAKALYYGLVKPLVWVIMKGGYHFTFRNKKCIRYCRKDGFFIYGNHTNYMPDAFIPNMLRHKYNSIITSADAVSIPGLQSVVRAIGAIPLGDTLSSKKSFMKTVKSRLDRRESIAIYPEAHIWPYYTGIRPFSPVMMKYPCMYNVPCYTTTLCYQKRWIGKRPRLVCYVDGPFYPDMDLPQKERMEKLCREITFVMAERTRVYSTYSVNQYIYKEN